MRPFYLELTTGLRRGELLALQWTDLDVEKQTLSVTKAGKLESTGELVVSPPKTRNSVRTLALPQQAVDLLVSEHKKHPRNPVSVSHRPRPGPCMTRTLSGEPMIKILKAIGAEHIRFSMTLRHTFATLSLKSGVDVKNAVRRAGSLLGRGFTLNTYTHATAQMKAGTPPTPSAGHQPADAVRAKNRGQTEKIPVWPCQYSGAFPRVGQRVSLEETAKN